MYARGKSDGPVVPTKRANKTGTPAAESVEERGSPKGNAASHVIAPDTVPGLQGIVRAATAGRDLIILTVVPKGGAV